MTHLERLFHRKVLPGKKDVSALFITAVLPALTLRNSAMCPNNIYIYIYVFVFCALPSMTTASLHSIHRLVFVIDMQYIFVEEEIDT